MKPKGYAVYEEDGCEFDAVAIRAFTPEDAARQWAEASPLGTDGDMEVPVILLVESPQEITRVQVTAQPDILYVTRVLESPDDGAE